MGIEQRHGLGFGAPTHLDSVRTRKTGLDPESCRVTSLSSTLSPRSVNASDYLPDLYSWVLTLNFSRSLPFPGPGDVSEMTGYGSGSRFDSQTPTTRLFDSIGSRDVLLFSSTSTTIGGSRSLPSTRNYSTCQTSVSTGTCS